MEKTRNQKTATELLTSNSKLKSDFSNLNKVLKSVIVDFKDGNGEIIIDNDNFGTRRKYPDFHPEKHGLHRAQIVCGGIWCAAHIDDQAYIDNNNNICYFADLLGVTYNYIVELRGDDFGDSVYIAENGFTDDKSEAKRFPHKRLAKKAAFEFIKNDSDTLEAIAYDVDVEIPNKYGYRRIDGEIVEIK